MARRRPACTTTSISRARSLLPAAASVPCMPPTLPSPATSPTPDSAIGAWRRVFLPYADDSLAVAIATILLEAMAWVVPLLLPILAWLSDAGPRLIVASFVPLLLLGAMRVALTLTQREPFTTVLWHPVTVGLTLLGQLAGIVDHVIGRAPRWRGRIVEPAGRSEVAAEPRGEVASDVPA